MHTDPRLRADTHPGVALIRDRTEGDLDACAHLLADVHADDGYPVNWPPRPADWLAPAGALGAWVAEWSGQVMGHVTLCPGTPGDVAAGLWSSRAAGAPERAAVVSRLFVPPAARGHGLGTLLLTRAVREATGRGLHPVLEVAASDTAATALYERQGWLRLATLDQDWGAARPVTVHCYAHP
ncbi:GNAT family N-acetyltransferase [Streptomyces sp. NBC_01186]|uniref:GNAT family N-acetyltransferase n=1 Tax=Streptomyces sp. NBC_01186 TaxID=2903765 RepID=UPI002E12CFE3|nr:GNAT family N-acetyltransferase [Streptomyces sp. NBC_01186]